MKDYKLTDTDTIIRAKDGAAIPADPRNGDRRDYEAWLVAGNAPDAAGPRPAPVISWSALTFLERFTKLERNSIRAAAKQNADLEDWLDLLRAAGEVRADDPRTVAGMDALVAAGLLTAARRAEILS